MYVPVVKNQYCEFGAMKRLLKAGLVSDGIYPFVKFLIVDDQANKVNYYHDPKRVSELFSPKQVFVDYYRCDIGAYGRVDVSKLGETRRMSADADAYLEEMKSLASFENFIPVFSIRQDVINPAPDALLSAIVDIRHAHPGKHVGICVDAYYAQYNKAITSVLGEDDFIFFDSGEAKPRSRKPAIRKVLGIVCPAKKVLLNSPRKRSLQNGDYPEHGFATFIDNDARDDYSSLGFDGFGDFAGLRDDLKLNIRIPGEPRGRALVLLYDYDTNQFMSYMNPDSRAAQGGFRDLAPVIDGDMHWLNPGGNCIALNEFLEKRRSDPEKFGGYTFWVTATVVRYIQQIETNMFRVV